MALFDAGALAWIDVFVDADAARSYAAEHLRRVIGLELLRISLASDLVDVFVAHEDETVGHAACALRGLPLDPMEPAEALGHEIAGCDMGTTAHSHHCNDLSRDYASALGISENRHGLIDEEQDARRAALWTGRDEVGAEPCLWMPWLVERLELTA